MSNKIYTNHTLEEYNKKYRNRGHRLLKYRKEQVEDFDNKYCYFECDKKAYPLKQKDYLLKDRSWWLIGDTYYEIPKPIRFTWFRNLNAAIQIGTCVVLGCAVTAAIVVPSIFASFKNILLRTSNELTLEKGQISYIQYDKSNLNSKVPNVSIDNENIIHWLGKDPSIKDAEKYDAFNGYYPICASNVGTTYVSFKLNGYFTTKVKVNVVDNEFKLVNKDENQRGEAIYLLNEAIMKKTPSIALPYKTAFIKEGVNIMSYAENAQMLIDYDYFTDNQQDPKYMKFIFSYLDNTGTDLSYNPALQKKLLINANSALRRNENDELIGNTLPIDDITDTFEVTESDQLWWCIEHGKKPVFTKKNSTAELCYKKAREICSKFPKSILEGNDYRLKIIKTVYEHCIDNYVYNFYLIKSPEEGGIPKFADKMLHSAYYLEGPLLAGTCVCDGYCKVYALLCGMLGLNKDNLQVVRSTGFSKTGTGHGYNYVSIDGTKKHYLVCPTWGLTQYGFLCLPNYTSFLQTKNYFKEFAGEDYDFDDLPWTYESSIYKIGTKPEDKPYYEQSVLQADGYLYNESEIETNLTSVFNQCATKNISEPFVVSFACTTSVVDKINDYVANAKNNVNKYQSYNSYGIDPIHKKFNGVYFYSAILIPPRS